MNKNLLLVLALLLSSLATPICATRKKNKSPHSSATSSPRPGGKSKKQRKKDYYKQTNAATSSTPDLVNSGVNTPTIPNNADASTIAPTATIAAAPAKEAATPSLLRTHKNKAFGIVGIVAIATAYYKYAAPRLAKRVKAMQNGRIKRVLSVLTFAKKN
ncbi:MAG: hypothetical protein ACD_64C00249G0002 [uncultured bacterium]|nr:MAG: hypothetical protein ACD_64C00249G0002 [uncultured bacterium]